jgi:hypothetical protein
MDDEKRLHYVLPLWKASLRQVAFSFAPDDRAAIHMELGQMGASNNSESFIEAVEDRIATYAFLAQESGTQEKRSEVKRQLRVLRNQSKGFLSKIEKIPHGTKLALEIALQAPPRTRNLLASLSDQLSLLDHKLEIASQMVGASAKPGRPGNPWRHRLIIDVLAIYQDSFGEHANVTGESLHGIFHRILEAAGFPAKDIDIQPLLDAAAEEIKN